MKMASALDKGIYLYMYQRLKHNVVGKFRTRFNDIM